MTAIGLAIAAPEAHAYDVYARGQLGLYRSQERFSEPAAGTNSNDSQALLGSFYLNGRGVAPVAHELVIDVRDRYDSYGAVDPEFPRLVESHAPELRQLAVKDPDGVGDYIWSVGRFTVPEAALTANDGGEIGYRLSPRLSLGAFGGLYPERLDGHAIPVAAEKPQAGAYAAYQERGSQWGQHTYAATSLVARQESDDVTTFTTAAGATPETPLEKDEATTTVSRLYWYTNAVYQPRPTVRVTGLTHVDLSPGTHLRNLWLSGFNQFNPKTSATLSGLLLDLTEYERRRELRDDLPPSTFTQVKALGKYRFGRTTTGELTLANGVRGFDGRSRVDVFGRGIFAGLLDGRLATHGGLGWRKNFTSTDTYVKGGVDLYLPRLELGLTQMIGSEAQEDGETLHPMITDVSANMLFGRQVFVGLTAEYTKDERVTIMSGILTAGFRLGSRQLTPMRDRAPGWERL